MQAAGQVKSRAALISVISNSSLVALKIAVGLAIGSVSVISEAIHSGVDLIAALIALFAVRTAARPADEHHPFGHGKMENLSGAIEALLIFVAAGWIIFEAVKRLMRPEPIEQASWGVAVMLISCAANTGVSSMLFRVGRQTDSVALLADAWHLRTDVYTSAGVMAGLAVIWAGSRAWPGVDLHWVDPLAAIAVALLIIRAAYHLTVQAGRDLLDAALPREEEQWIHDHISSHSPRVQGYHGLRTRKSGSQRFVEVHLLVDPAMTVEESHSVTDYVALRIEEQFPSTTVTIHIEPSDGRFNILAGDGKQASG